MTINTKKILIETESHETYRLHAFGPEVVRAHCPQCERVDEMLDLNSAADISGTTARELMRLVESGTLHSPENTSGHLLICRSSLEHAINIDEDLRPRALMLEERQ